MVFNSVSSVFPKVSGVFWCFVLVFLTLLFGTFWNIVGIC